VLHATGFTVTLAALFSACFETAFGTHVFARVALRDVTAERRIGVQAAFVTFFTIVVAACFTRLVVSALAAQHDAIGCHALGTLLTVFALIAGGWCCGLCLGLCLGNASRHRDCAHSGNQK
jgi:hypothetical protein